MQEKVAVSTTFVPDSSELIYALELLNKGNIDIVELGSNHCYEGDYSYLERFNFKYLVHNYFPIPKESFIVNIASLNNKIRLKSINHIKKAIEFCENIGAHLYTFHPGFMMDPDGSNISSVNYDFQWDENQIKKSNFNYAKLLMYNSLDEIIPFARKKSVKIAIETEGAVKKKDYLLMQQPREYKEFISKYTPQEIGINLNIGHLNLAANGFKFGKEEFVDLVQDYVVAMELSHNNGIEDQHLPLETDGWYWPLINDRRFKNIYKILEYRNTPAETIITNMELFRNIKKNI